MLARKALAGTAAAPKVYVEDVFSTYLYTATGTSSGQTITNNIDLSGKGGMLWIKDRTDAGTYPVVVDTARGANKWIYTSSTAAEATSTSSVTSFTSSGFVLGTDNGSGDSNSVNYAYSSPSNYVSWTFRKAEKFFDVVTYTGNGQVSAQNIAHNLGSVPGMIIVKRTDNVANWAVYHRSMGATKFMRLNITNGEATSSDYWNNTEPTSTQFTVGIGGAVNDSGTYVAYLFAHDAGGFGDAGDQSVISCGSFTTNGSGIATVTLGYEPQWVLIKRTDSTSEWHLLDNMRGFAQGVDAWVRANSSAAESSAYSIATPTATGFVTDGTNIIDPSATFIYIAIRRGPMKTPEAGTEVYNAITRTGSGADVALTTVGFPVDWVISGDRTAGFTGYNAGRLTGANRSLLTTSTGAESTDATRFTAFDSMNGFSLGSSSAVNNASRNYVYWNFKRAPGFFDVVCYTGTGSSTTVSHNLGVVPELMLIKARTTPSVTGDWLVYSQPTGNTDALFLNTNDAKATSSGYWNNTTPTSSSFTVGVNGKCNESSINYVAYLFASLSGVSKVGSYTGTGTTLQVNCGFTNGSRFVLIKRTDSTGDWYLWDSARGIVAGNDPYLLLNSTAAEVTNTDYVDTYSAGFEISSTAPAAINANGGTFIYLAVA